MQAFQDVFISYGRADSKAFAAQLNHRFVKQGFTVWFDFDDIPLGVDYQKQIDDGIDKADNFLFLISPHSVNSPYCCLEIELALKRSKRIIPLLHVEQISHATWQQRNPTGTDADWEAYQAAGKHSSYSNMHPAIGKINWVYFREGIDDFETSFAGLLAIFDRHKEYVHQHTLLLAKALEWEQQQKRSPYLLVGEERIQAEEWLKVRFKDSQPPCLPTPLHCEFITESRKNADNLMSEVFLAYAEDDRVTAEQVRDSLQREGFTVWINTTDIHVGAEFQQVIHQGIEEANNVVYLLSSSSVRSPWCQHELDYALSLHKRVIPVLVEEIAQEQFPLKLRNLQYVDLSDNVQETDYQQDESQLLRILRQDAAYHEDRKVLLAKALKWERQHRNPAILLRGYNLSHAEAWLKIAHRNVQYPPTSLQEEFITESLRQPPGLTQDVFISYSRTDSGFARHLNNELQSQGKKTWFDQESIASGVDFQEEIYCGIENSSHFLFILSPNSIASPYCASEVEYAASLNKRFVTVLHRSVNPVELHPELAKVQWIDFNQQEGDFGANFKELLHTLDNDPLYLRSHTRLLVRAIEWDNNQRDESYLLRGADFREAEAWLEQSANVQPKPTELQLAYLAVSREAEAEKLQLQERRRAAWTMLLVMQLATFVPFVGGFYWLYQTSINTAIASHKEDLVETMEAAAERIDGDELVRLSREAPPRPEGYSQVNDPAYWNHVRWLATVEKIVPRAYLYTYVAGSEPRQIVFIGSGSAVNHLRETADGNVQEFDGVHFLTSYVPTSSNTLIEGLSKLTILEKGYSDAWGTWMTGCMPIKNAAGEAVAAIGIDFYSNRVVAVQKQIERSFWVGSLVFGVWVVISSFVVLKRVFPADERQLWKKKIKQERKWLRLPHLLRPR